MSTFAIPAASKFAVPAANKTLGTPTPITDPTGLPNLAAWYRADQGITIVTGVSQWNDLSGNSKHLQQATLTNQPLFVASGINSQPTVRFDGVDNFMTSSSLITARGHVFAVLKQVTAQNQPWFSQGDTTNGFCCSWLSGAVRCTVFVAASGTGLGATCSASSDTSFHYISLNAFTGATSTQVVYYDGINIGTGTDGTGGYGPVANVVGNARSDGGGTFAAVEIAELIVYSASKAGNERKLLKAYFKTRYAL
jgi:hypothetical protein